MVEMTVHNVESREGKYAVVLLKEVGGERELQMVVGQNEAVAMLRHLTGMKEKRPLTHDLMKDLIEAAGWRVERVAVNDWQSCVYYGKIKMVRDGKEAEVDARPSDAIALGVRCGARIYVEETVIELAGRGKKEKDTSGAGGVE